MIALLLATTAATAVAAPTLAPVSAPAPMTVAAPADTAGDEPQRSDEVVVTGQRTEGSSDYAAKNQTTAYRLAISERETPQSVSTVTRAQIEDFQLNDINQVLAQVPGVNVQAVETDRILYSARGFDIQTFQIDGLGLPFAFEINVGSIDTAIYDRIEVLKGASGLLSSTGNPSAVVNFIRKRPTREFAGSASAQYGSFNALRLDADVSVPLTKGGGVRARAVGVYNDTDSYLDRYHLRRWTGYGIVEADLGPNTVVSAGYGHQDHQSHGAMWGALPLAYTDGTLIPLRRETNTGPDWAGWNVIDRQIFGDITHQIAPGWTLRIAAQRRAIDENDQLFYVYGNPERGAPGGINLSNPDNPAGIFSYPGAFRARTRNLTLDAYVAGKIAAFGQEHDVLLGVNRSAQAYGQVSSYDVSRIGVPLAVDGSAFDGSFPRPNFPTTYSTDPNFSQDSRLRRETVYGLVRLHLADAWKVMAGGNWTHASNTGISYGSSVAFDRSRFQPFVGTTFDLTGHITAYASYATIFNPQSSLDAQNQILPPIEGDNLEGGLKGEWFGGRLNASIAAFQVHQRNTAQSRFDTTLGRFVNYLTDPRSQGLEAQVSGRLIEGLQATAGYTLMRIENPDGSPARTFVPRNTGRLNLSYAPPRLSQLKFGASLAYQSRIYLEPGVDAGMPVLSSTTGRQVRITQGGYAMLDLFARYDLTRRIGLAVNVRNVTDKNYITALNYSQGYYGAPRSVLGTISLRY